VSVHDAVEDSGAAARSWTLLVYALYLAALFTALPLLLGGIVALWKRRLATGTVYASHLANQVTVLWVGLHLGVLGWILTVVLVGWAILGLLWLWILWRSGRGLLRALDGRPYR
jgi:uncharacterized membrane protein